MGAAAFVLAINLFIAAMFATAFGVVAAYQRSAIGARWLAFAYAMGMVSAVFEFVLPFQSDHRLVSFAIFATFLLAMAGCVIGLAYHYGLARPWRVLGVIITAALIANIFILDMPRQSLLRGLVYQGPYFLVQMVAVLTLLRTPRWRALDVALLALLAISGLQFLAKPFMALAIGSGDDPQAYLTSTYAAFSQALGSIVIITNGLLMLLIIVRDVMADMTARSETDTLSGLFNRRGFEDRGARAVDLARRSGAPAVLVVADLDHFKAINDTFGHAAGDAVIARFSEVLRRHADDHAISGRLGGEEFAVILPGANVASGRAYAEAVRRSFREVSHADLNLDDPISASFGVAQMTPGDSLSDLMRRADRALYNAKTGGRDRVSVAMSAIPTTRLGTEPDRQSRNG